MKTEDKLNGLILDIIESIDEDIHIANVCDNCEDNAYAELVNKDAVIAYIKELLLNNTHTILDYIDERDCMIDNVINERKEEV